MIAPTKGPGHKYRVTTLNCTGSSAAFAVGTDYMDSCAALKLPHMLWYPDKKISQNGAKRSYQC
eukprot:500838-Amphidinium_carterae.1